MLDNILNIKWVNTIIKVKFSKSGILLINRINSNYLPPTFSWGLLPVLMSRNVPVPMVSFTSPIWKQHSPNMAACWSATCQKFKQRPWNPSCGSFHCIPLAHWIYSHGSASSLFSFSLKKKVWIEQGAITIG